MRSIGRKAAVMVTAFSLGLGLYITNVGCGGGPVRQTLNSSNVKLQYLKQALLVTDGVKIEFVEDGKSITSGEPFLPTSYVPRAPVENDVSSASLRSYIEAQGYYGVDFAQSSVGRVWIRHVTPDSPAANAGLRFAEIYEINGEDVDTVSDVWARFNEARRDVPVNESTRVKGPDLEVTLMAAESPKPAKVLVHVPGRSQPLYGRIAFFPVYSSAQGSAARVYRIAVPDSYVQAAKGGAVSVVYQPYDWTDVMWAGSGAGAAPARTAVSWALWMSDVPI